MVRKRKGPFKLYYYLYVLFSITLLPLDMAKAQTSTPQTFTLDGKFYEAGTANPLIDSNVGVRIQILNHDKTCLLYEETQVVDTSTSAGNFSIKVGSAVGSGKRSVNDSGLTMNQIFQNTLIVQGKLLSNLSTACDVAANAGALAHKDRYFRIYVDPTVGAEEALTPDMAIDAVPSALVAESVQGLSKDSILQVSSGHNLTQTNLQNIFTGTRYTDLLDLILGNSAQYVGSDGSNFTPTAPIAFNNQRITNLAAPSAGTDAVNKTYSDTKIAGQSVDASITGIGAGDAGKFLQWDGIKWVAATASTTDATKLPLAGGTMSGNITMGGYDLLNTGYITMNTNKYLHLSNNAASPGGLNATHEGAIWYDSVNDVVKYWDGTTAKTVGNPGIATLGGLSATSQSFAVGTAGTAPAWSSVTDTHTLNIPMASGAGVTAGLLSKTDYDSFVAKVANAGGTPSILSDVIASRPAFGTAGRLFVSTDEKKIYRDTGSAWEEISPTTAFTVVGSTLTNGRFWVGNASSQAAEVQMSGDATMDNAGAVTIANNAITTAKINDAAVTTAKINDGAVTTAKVADANVTPAKLAASSALGRLPIVNGTNSAFDWLGCAVDQSITWDAALGFICETAYTFGTGDLLIARQGAAAGQGAQIKLQSNSGTNNVILKAPDGLASDLTLRLPATAGSNGHVLTTDGSGNLSWSASSGGVSTVTTFDTTSTANGMSISGSNIKLHAADGTNPGGVSTGTQTFAGAKTFSGAGTFSAAGTGLSITNNASVGGNLTVDTTTLFVDATNDRLGVGTVTPRSRVDVSGSIVSRSSSTTTGSIDFNLANAITTSFDCSTSISFANLRDGGSYTLVVTSTGTTQCNFSTTTTGEDAATVTYRMAPANGARVASSHTVYSIQRVGTIVYVSWITGF